MKCRMDNDGLDEGECTNVTFASQERQVLMTELHARNIIESIQGEDPDRNGLDGTPCRFSKAFAFFTSGYEMDPWEVADGAIFPVEHNEMVVLKDVPLYSLCEHHLIPFFGKAHVAYIPDPNIGVLGLSKVPRIIDVFARRLQVQERLTQQVMDALQEIIKPKGVAVVLECRHMCMEMRGVQKASVTTVTKACCGIFEDDPSAFAEFTMLAFRGDDSSARYNSVTSVGPVKPVEPLMADSSKALRKALDVASDADDYMLYAACASEEFETIANVICEATEGPMSEKKQSGLTILDIGAGDGRVLKALCSGKRPQEILHYTAFEKDVTLYRELKSAVLELGFDSGSQMIRNETFSPYSKIEDAGGPADVVLLSHSLYGFAHKERIVAKAMEFVAPGGVFLIFHRWEAGGTLDRLKEYLTSQSIIYHYSVFDFELNVFELSAQERLRVGNYVRAIIEEGQNTIICTMGCIAVEPHSCRLNDASATSGAIEAVRKKVSYAARNCEPAAVVTPNTAVGIQACLHAASLRCFEFDSVSVLGGGHSANCFADGSLVINMRLWNHVVVDPSRLTVRVGGGVTIGEITQKCEEHGLAVPLGDRPGVGMGLVLQGGLNHFMRSHGLASDNILRVVYVSPSGELAVAEQEAELLRFRGAGTNFGVVVEVSLRAYKIAKVVAQDTIYAFNDSLESQVLTRYSRAAMSLPDTACLDGFIFWSSHDTISLATSYFDTDIQGNGTRISPSLQTSAAKVIYSGKLGIHSPLGLFDRELYMTEAFEPSAALAPGSKRPAKLRSLKRCLLFRLLDQHLESIVNDVIREVPTKWCYIHILHGGGAVKKVSPEDSAFGCRNWEFAAVLTARWPQDEVDLEKESVEWLQRTVGMLLPHSAGVYSSDLGPSDLHLASLAFGRNNIFLAQKKRIEDPLNVLRHGCPLISDSNDKGIAKKGVVVIFCGRRCVGKDWLAQVAQQTLRSLVGDREGCGVSIARISDATKMEYAATKATVNANLLIHSRGYKESHRMDLSAFYQKKKAQDVAYDARCFVEVIDSCSSGILLLTGMRDGFDYARSVAGKAVVFVKVDASQESKLLRGWKFDEAIDRSPGECTADQQDETFWDLTYNNSSESTLRSAEEWVKLELAPCILKSCIRRLPNTPKPGIEYKDIVGNLLLQPFGLSLCNGLFVRWLRNYMQDNIKVDAIVAPEALGFVFASPIAAQLNKPLVLVRKEGKLPGAVDKVLHHGSNMQNLFDEDESPGCHKRQHMEIISGSIRPGQNVIIVDDCLASGSTVSALHHLVRFNDGNVTALLCVIELPDLLGRKLLEKMDIAVFSLMDFTGK